MSAVAATRLFHVKPRLPRALRPKGTLLVILAWFAVSGAWAHPARGVPLVQDLAAEGKAAREKNQPVLVMFGTPNCPFCRQVLNEFLFPMSRNADYQAKVIMVQVEIGSSRKLVDFSGQATTHGQFARRYQIKLAPTVVLFDASGRVLGEPLVGMITPDYYGAFLDRAIDEAVDKLRDKPSL